MYASRMSSTGMSDPQSNAVVRIAAWPSSRRRWAGAEPVVTAVIGATRSVRRRPGKDALQPATDQRAESLDEDGETRDGCGSGPCGGRFGGPRPSRWHLVRRDLARHAVGELADQLVRHFLDEAGAAAVLGNRSGELQIGGDGDARARAVGREREVELGLGAAATLGVASLGLDLGATGSLVRLGNARFASDIHPNQTGFDVAI